MQRLNKTLIQKDRGGFQNGPWNGHFEGQGGARRYFTIQLHFHKNGTVDGSGQDQIGKFKLKDALFDRNQTPHTFKARLKWDSKLEMAIAGVLDPSTSSIHGTYSSNSGDGSVTMQPTFTGITDNMSSDTVTRDSPGSSPSHGAQQLAADRPSRPPIAQPNATRSPQLRPQASVSQGGRRHSQGHHSEVSMSGPSEAELDSINSLMEMGFDRRLCEHAVYNAGTREAQVEWIYNNMDNLAQLSSRPARRQQPARVTFGDTVPEDLVQQMVAMGFEAGTAKIALQHHNNDVSAAAEFLLAPPPAEEPLGGHHAGGRRDPYEGFLSVPPAQRRPPEVLVQQLMDIVQVADEHLAVIALMENDNDLELAVNWVLEGGSAPSPQAEGFDDIFNQPSGEHRHGGVQRQDEGNMLALNRRQASHAAPQDDFFSIPANPKPGRAASSGFDDFFSSAAPSVPPSVAPASAGAADFDLFSTPSAVAHATSGKSSDSAPKPPGRSAPPPPKRAPPPPPKVGAKDPVGGAVNPLTNFTRPTAPGVPSHSSANPLSEKGPAGHFDPFPSAHSTDFFSGSASDKGHVQVPGSDPFSSSAHDNFQAPSRAAAFDASNDMFPATSENFFPTSGAGFSSNVDPFPTPFSDAFPSASGDPFHAPPADLFPAAPMDPFPAPPARLPAASDTDPFSFTSPDPFSHHGATAPFANSGAEVPHTATAPPKPAAATGPLDDFLF